MNHKQLIRKSGLYFIGNLSSKVLTVIILPIYAFYLSTSSLGYFDYSQTIVNILQPILYLAIWEGILKFILSAENKTEISKIITTSICFIGFISVLLCLVFFGVSRIWAVEHMNFIVLMFFSQGIAQIWQYFARSLKENTIFVLSGIISTVVNFILILILVVFLKLEITGLYISFVIGQLSVITIIESKLKLLKKVSLKEFDRTLLSKILKFSSPLTINLVSAWFMSGYARFFITNNFGAFDNGLYTFANKFSQIVNIFGSVIVMAMVEEAIIARNNENYEDKLSEVLNSVTKLFMYLIFILIPVISLFYKVVDNTNYASSISFVPLLLLYTVYMIFSSAIGVVFQVVEKTHYQFYTTMIGAIVTVLLSFLLIDLGVMSVVIAQVLGSIILFLSRFYLSKKYLVLNIKIKKTIFTSLLFLIVSIFIITKGILLNILYLLFLLVYFVYFNQKIINMYYVVIKNKLKGR